PTRLPPSLPLFPYTTLSDLPPGADRLDSGLSSQSMSSSMSDPPAADLARAAAALARARYAIALVGAGISVESGIPPFRGKGGLRSEEHTSELQSRFDLVCRL